MDKLKMESIDMTQKNIEKIEALFPNVITEMKDENGKLKKGINFELLKQELSKDLVDGEECYDFTWVGKKASIIEGNTPIRKTLRPCREESKDWEKTENLYIEGDNLDALKLLQESYLNSVKMIYIDPPYNTGNDFIYKDKFTMDKDEYEDEIGLYDDEDNRLFKNTETNGRFHSDWCSMLYPRLKLAHNLLSEDGVIFISIDDNENYNLRKICDEIFGINQFISKFIWRSRQNVDSRSLTGVSNDHEYILCYSKMGGVKLKGKEINKDKYNNNDNDPRGPWMSSPMDGVATAERRPNLHYQIINSETGIVYNPNPANGWRFQKSTVEKLIKENRIIWPKNPNSKPRFKRYLNELNSQYTGFSSILEVDFTATGTKELRELMEMETVKFPKPVSLIKTLINQNINSNDIALDFFSGSSTTAQSVMQLNAEDGGNRKFIMVQLPEPCDEKSEAHKAGYKNICEIGKERIRRAGEKIKTENKDKENIDKLDVGFRVFKVDSTNMKDVYYSANEYGQQMIAGLESNIKEDRSDLDLLYGVLLDWGIPLSLNHKIEKIENTIVHFYDYEEPPKQADKSSLLPVNCSLAACFAEKVSEDVVRAIAKLQPLRVVFRDSSFASSAGKINVEEIFKLKAPNTSVKVI